MADSPNSHRDDIMLTVILGGMFLIALVWAVRAYLRPACW